MIAAIHQPNFFPWLGYFSKIYKADIFVFLDEVQFPRTGKGSWVNRVRVLNNNKSVWLTCPVARNKSTPLIKNVYMAEGNWRQKTLQRLQGTYAKTPKFKEIFPFIEALVRHKDDNLARFNIHAIKRIAKLLALNIRWLKQSELTDREIHKLQGSARLAAVCKSINATTYLAGDGAHGYEDPEAYRKNGIKLATSGFQCLEYKQSRTDSFLPGLSVIDALFHVGPEGTRRLIVDS